MNKDFKDYKIITTLGIKTVQGKPIDMVEIGLPEYAEFEFFVHEEYDANPCGCSNADCSLWWSVSEKKSGKSIGKGETPEEAIREAVSNMKDRVMSVNKFRKALEKQAMPKEPSQ